MTSQTAFSQLQSFLKDMFQFDDHDLDFGIYRIIRLKQTFQLFSFILLRDSSTLGSWNGLQPSPKDREIIQSMREKNVLRLNWSETHESDDRVDRRPDKQSYLDMMFESIGLEF